MFGEEVARVAGAAHPRGKAGSRVVGMSDNTDKTASAPATHGGADSEGDWQRTTIDSAQAAAHPETAAAVARIKELRQSIDNVDAAIISLLAERFKTTSKVGVLKARAGFAPEDMKREDYQIERLHRIAIDAGLDPEIAEKYREFVVTEAKKRHQRIAEAGGDPGVLDLFA